MFEIRFVNPNQLFKDCVVALIQIFIQKKMAIVAQLEESTFDEYVPVAVSEIGFADEHGTEGMLKLKSSGSSIFAMRAFSGEVAMHISRFARGDRSSIPSIFNIIEELAEKNGLHLARVEVYPSGDVLRSDMKFVGKDAETVLDGYRASDAIALALFYDAPIFLHRSLLEEESKKNASQDGP